MLYRNYTDRDEFEVKKGKLYYYDILYNILCLSLYILNETVVYLSLKTKIYKKSNTTSLEYIINICFIYGD